MVPVTIGIAGGSASGKTTVAREIAARLGARCVLIAHDRYYRTAPPRTEDAAPWNFDHPDAIDTDHLLDDLRRLREGGTTALPVYDFATHTRTPIERWDRVESRPVVIVEGILVLAIEPLRQRLDLRVYVDAPDDLRLMRRIRRDLAERGREVTDVLEQYEQTVRPMHDRFVVPSRSHADVVLDGTRSPGDEAERLLARIEAAVSPAGRRTR